MSDAKDRASASQPEKPAEPKKKKRRKIGSLEGGLDLDQILGCAGCLFAPFRWLFMGILRIIGAIFDAD